METELPEWADDLIEAIESADDIRDKHGALAEGVHVMAAETKHLPRYLRNEEVMRVASAHMTDPLDLIAGIIRTCDEHGHFLGKRILVEWRGGKWTSCGMMVRGKAGPIPKRQRLTWPSEDGPAPWFRITLSLPAWLLLDDDERYRLLHHEMGHCGISAAGQPITLAHEVEEFVSTSARFGPAHPDHIRLSQAIAHHPETVIRMREWEIDDRGQGQLFGVWKGPRAAVDEAI